MITVKLSDATLKLGGDFHTALAFVKSFTGRSYDGSTKTWAVPATLKAFTGRCTLPFDVQAASGAAQHRSGEHVTRYGTRYSSDEWAARREYNAVKVPAALVQAAQAREADADQALLATLRGFGMDDAAIARLRRIEKQCMGDLREAEEFGKITFSSPERRAAIEAAFEAWYDAMLKADDAIDAFLSGEERRIDEKYGFA